MDVNQHGSEPKEPKTNKIITSIIVRFLDNSEASFEIEKREKAQVLINKVLDHLELYERDYFGLQFSDLNLSAEEINSTNPSELMRWLDPTKSFKKQIRFLPPYLFYFRVKFYVSEPSCLKEEYTRYHFFLQLTRDLIDGKLKAPPRTAILLASYAIQSELGDYNPEQHGSNYLSEFQFVPNQTPEMLREVESLHKKHRGLSPALCEMRYIDLSRKLDGYGIDLFNAILVQTNVEIQLGVTSVGLMIFKKDLRINSFTWDKIVKISFKRKLFYIHLHKESTDKELHIESILGFHMSSYRSCKNLWKSCVEHHTFFCLHNQNHDIIDRHNNGQLVRSKAFRQDYPNPMNNASMHVSYPGPVNGSSQIANTSHNFVSGRTSMHDGIDSAEVPKSNARGFGILNRKNFGDQNSIYMKATEISSDEEDEAARRHLHTIETPTPVIVTIPKMQILENNLRFNENHYHKKSNEKKNDFKCEGLIKIKMVPENGKFGFNIKGGLDQSQPIIVSRVAPNSPADKCDPHLSQGDQVIFINGRDVSQHTHEQVVEFIRAASESHSGELELIIKQNVYINDSSPNEPDFQYIPDTQSMVAVLQPGGNALAASINLLKELIDSNAGAAQFENLYRKKAGFTFNTSQLPENIKKNRYTDILPYDETRVKLKTTENDYINANFINMIIPGSCIINRYIACQGPLPETCADFWAMTWEQRSNLIVMLTLTFERGRPKCHNYWPDEGTIAIYGNYRVTCTSENATPYFVFIDLKISSLLERDSPERHVHLMQYQAWPDHGVPDDASNFLSFVQLVRKHRAGLMEPIIVHCSAGIGRTGVLIAMETAMCMIEANEPIHMLEIVKQMRDQRAMLIQTTGQYTFVCEAVVKVYDERIVVPLSKYTHR